MTQDWLAGSAAVVTGGARGQGEAEVRLLAAAGAHAFIGDVLQEEGRQLAAELGDAATFVRLDVSEEKDWDGLAEQVSASGLPLRALVNNAGIMSRQGVSDFDTESFRRVLDINVVGTALGMRVCAPLMPTGSAIVTVSSIAAVRAIPTAAAYSASKWAVVGLTRGAAKEFTGRGIRVNAVQPGVITTDMVLQNLGDEATVYARHEGRLAVPRLGRSADVAEAVMFLLSDRAAYITGTELLVDGGWVLG